MVTTVMLVLYGLGPQKSLLSCEQHHISCGANFLKLYLLTTIENRAIAVLHGVGVLGVGPLKKINFMDFMKVNFL